VSTEHSSPVASPHLLLAHAASALARGDGEDPLVALLRIALEATGADRVAVHGRDPEQAALVLLGSLGRFGDGSDGGADEATRQAALEGIASLGRATDADGVTGTAADLPLVVAHAGIDQGLGALSVRWRERRDLDASDASLLGALADLLAVAIDRARLASLAESQADRADRLAMMDTLTGLANARTLDRVLELEVTRAGRQNGALSVAVFDIDGFAAVNEMAGRAAGDDVLREVAAALAASVRLVDTVARTGADEFVIVAPGSAGRTVAERVLAAVGTIEVQGVRAVAVSGGVAGFPIDGANPAELLAAARRSLEAARGSGGGRIAGGEGAATA
jgi:diguanylate cyclase (GGDEF)-like protein